MFLDAVRRRNPGLLRFAAQLHRSGVIPPNTFVFDRGAVRRNAERLAERAAALGLDLYYMAKQIAYDAQLVAAIRSCIPGAVAVDWMGAEALLAQGAKVQHVGHLVPIPARLVPALMAQARPEVWTLLDLEAAEAVNRAALALGRVQSVLLRINGGDFFPGQEGGFAPEEVLAAATTIARLPGLRLSGVTSYPCFTWDEEATRYRPTANLEALVTSAERLRAAGFSIEQINAPGNTSLSVLPLLAQYGASHGEPGHALTGTTPEQSLGSSEEEPAVVYVSEVSAQLSGGQALAYGGGLYARAHARQALVGTGPEELEESAPVTVRFPPPQFIDYQCLLEPPRGRHLPTGATVLMAFRFQLFVLRSYRAVVEQDGEGTWRLLTLTPPF
ncbi:alanine racemase [Thermogemmatispora carboxidivorans]|uniref:alanine racemase n=1 Tax=Thermogemmatispora carboxidivorans TaxID=1382306 RepID=UPI00069B1488|nr:alanine racemase [Thermogemmatispora carboxidivorans]